MNRELTPSELTLEIDPAELGFAETSDLLGVVPGWIGQPRAEKAAQFGLAIDQAGYNLFVLGAAGSGRSTLMQRAMEQVAAGRPVAPDLVFLYNFELPERPVALHLQPGQGAALRSALEEFSRHIVRDIPQKLDEEGVRRDGERVKKALQAGQDQAYVELTAFAASRHFSLRREDGRLVFILVDGNGQVMQEDAVMSLSADERMALEAAEQELRGEIARYLEIVRPIEREIDKQLAQLKRAAAEPVVAREIDGIRGALAGKVVDQAKFETYLKQLTRDVLDSIAVFSGGRLEEADSPEIENLLARYRVNLLVDHGSARGAPALCDDDPVFRSLFGGIEYQAENGVLVTDFMRIRAGTLVRAHGGFLLLHLRDVIRDEPAWQKLQRFLRNGRLQIEEPSAAFGQLATTTLEPEPLALQVKLVLIASREDYYELQEADPDFFRYFRVKVDFVESFLTSCDTRREVAALLAQRCAALGLPHCTAAAVGRMLLEMHRKIDDRRRMSAQFGHLETLLVEASAYSRLRGAALVDLQDVETALAERTARHDYPEQAMLDAITDGELMIRIHGSEVGQINGLTQADLGDYQFGSPVRISAQVYAGEDGVMNIDREVELTGPTHDKGVLILQGWLSAAFAHLAPLCLSASLVFEQEYHGVEGDSASCAELFALLSALSGLPLPQGVALTGALNQHGEVLPIGGVNEKIEGYFRTCRNLGLDGTQGVIIPSRNRSHLLLDREVVDAVARGEFSISTIDNVLQGLELLTGLAAGEADAAGEYRADTVMGHVQHTLETFRKACDSGHLREHEHEHQK
ncbi:Lon protease [mine drainage metagenome]|uniref:Lon protease n=1 Tax=mine drainage metagenome TaxID=410659 RepID=A0A1J5QTG7_9ZZZZ